MKISKVRLKEIIREELGQLNLQESLDSDIAAASRAAGEDRSGMVTKWADEALERLRALEGGDLEFFKQKIRYHGKLPDGAEVEIKDVTRIEGEDAGFQVVLSNDETVEFKPVARGTASRYASGARKGGSRKPRRF